MVVGEPLTLVKDRLPREGNLQGQDPSKHFCNPVSLGSLGVEFFSLVSAFFLLLLSFFSLQFSC